jgi:hypothetical protein
MEDFVVSGSDSDESYTNRKKKEKSKGRSKSYREDSWDSAVTSDDSYTKKKSVKKKASGSKTSNSGPKSKPKYKRYSEDSDVEFESAKVNKKNILDEDEPIIGNRRTRGKRTKYNVILDDSSESEAEKSKGSGKQIKNCIDSTEDEYDAKEEEEEDEISEEDPDEYMDDEDSKEKSENDSGDINDQVQIDTERTSTHT